MAAFARHPVVDGYDLSALRCSAAAARRSTPRSSAPPPRGWTASSPQGSASPRPARSSACPDFAEPERLRVGTCGQLVPGIEAQVVDGELWIRSPAIFSGYRDDPAATAATIDADGWLHTGDLGEIDADGYVHAHRPAQGADQGQRLPGRARRARGGARRATRRSPTPCVAGVPDERSGERPKAWVVVSGPFDASELYDYVEERVAPYKQLVAIEPIDELPRTMTGKLLRRVLLERERTELTVSP